MFSSSADGSTIVSSTVSTLETEHGCCGGDRTNGPRGPHRTAAASEVDDTVVTGVVSMKDHSSSELEGELPSQPFAVYYPDFVVVHKVRQKHR